MSMTESELSAALDAIVAQADKTETEQLTDAIEALTEQMKPTPSVAQEHNETLMRTIDAHRKRKGEGTLPASHFFPDALPATAPADEERDFIEALFGPKDAG
jgi:hypothetical protein